MPWTVFNSQGQRKYLTAREIDNFVKAARKCSGEVRAFCWMLAFTGCRISEALALTGGNIDFEAKHVIFKCLKKRGKRVFRAVPLPPDLLRELTRWFQAPLNPNQRLWPWSRMTGYRRICEVMREAGIKGSYASPKGLRHGFGVRAIQASVPLTLVQRWLGHADIKTTAIYTCAMGAEEREIASRMWRKKASEETPVRKTQGSRPDSPDSEPFKDLSPRRQDDALRTASVLPRSAPQPAHACSPGQAPCPPRSSRLKRLLSCSVLQNWLNRLDQKHACSRQYSFGFAIDAPGRPVNTGRPGQSGPHRASL